MCDLVYDGARKQIDREALLWCQQTQASSEASDFALPYSFKILLQRNDGGDHIKRLLPDLHLLDFLFNDSFGAHCFVFALCDVRHRSLPQVVNVVDKHSIELPKRRIYIARDCDVYTEDR